MIPTKRSVIARLRSRSLEGGWSEDSLCRATRIRVFPRNAVMDRKVLSTKRTISSSWTLAVTSATCAEQYKSLIVFSLVGTAIFLHWCWAVRASDYKIYVYIVASYCSFCLLSLLIRGSSCYSRLSLGVVNRMKPNQKSIEPNRTQSVKPCLIGSVTEHKRTGTFRRVWLIELVCSITELNRTNRIQSTRLVRFCLAERQNASSWIGKISL